MHSVACPTATRRYTAGPTDDPTALFAQWQQHGDQAAREALVERFMPLLRSLARRELRGGQWRFVERHVQTDLIGDVSRHLRSPAGR
jgi:hypothetical protein